MEESKPLLQDPQCPPTGNPPPGYYQEAVPPHGDAPPPPVYAPNYMPPQEGGYPPPQGGYPPPQGNYPPQGGYPPPQEGYPPPQGGYGPGYPPQQQLPVPQYASTAPPPPQNTVVVQQQQPQVVTAGTYRFNESPVQIRCPNCNRDIVTKVSFSPGLMAWLLTGVLCIVGFLFLFCLLFVAWIPLVLDSCKDVEHTCPHCGVLCGTYKRMG